MWRLEETKEFNMNVILLPITISETLFQLITECESSMSKYIILSCYMKRLVPIDSATHELSYRIKVEQKSHSIYRYKNPCTVHLGHILPRKKLLHAKFE